MIRATLLILLVLTASSVAPATADQNDPRLGALFVRLKATQDPGEVAFLTLKIWEIWHKSGRPEIDALVEQGRGLMERKRLSAAAAVFDEVVRRAPRFAEGWNRRATVRYLLGNYEGSLEDIKRTLALEPRHFGALSGRGLVFLQLKRPRAAIKAFEAALAVNPHLSTARMNIKWLREHLRGKDI